MLSSPADRVGRHVLRAVLHAYDKVSSGHRSAREAVHKVLETGKLTSWPAPVNRAHGTVIKNAGSDRHVLQGLPGGADQDVIAESVAQLKQLYGWHESSLSGIGGGRARSARLPVGGADRLREIIERGWVFSWLILTRLCCPALFLAIRFSTALPGFFHREVAARHLRGLRQFRHSGERSDLLQSVATRSSSRRPPRAEGDRRLGMALVMNQNFRMQAITRALLLLPFNRSHGAQHRGVAVDLRPGPRLFNRVLVESGLATRGVSWLGIRPWR